MAWAPLFPVAVPDPDLAPLPPAEDVPELFVALVDGDLVVAVAGCTVGACG
jgi:hypothetical protein